MRPGIFIAVVVLVLMASAFVTAAFFFPFRQARLAPMLVSGIVLILAAVQLVRELRPRETTSASPMEREKDDHSEGVGPYLLESAWMAGFVVSIYVMGFLVAIPLFGLAYMKSHGAKWSISIMLPALITIFSWGIFSYLLGVKFYTGVGFRLLGSGY